MKLKALYQKWRNDHNFKTIVSSLFSLMITILFAIYHGVIGFLLNASFYITLAVFYFLLALIRGSILLSEKNNSKEKNEEKSMKNRRIIFILSMIVLLLTDVFLIVPISLLIPLQKESNLTLISSLVTACYTTYKIVMSTIHMRKQIKDQSKDVLLIELRVIAFIDALTSILTLQNTLILVCSEPEELEVMLRFSYIVGIFFFVAILALTIFWLCRGLKIFKAQIRDIQDKTIE